MTTELSYEQHMQIAKFAQADMKLARKSGMIYVTDTKYGTVELTYTKANRSYALISVDRTSPQRIAIRNMAASGCEMRLCSIYNIEFSN